MRLWTLSLPLVLGISACCFGGGASSGPVTHRLDPHGISIDLSAGHIGGPSSGGYLFTSGDGSGTVTVSSAGPGTPAAMRAPGLAVPGAVTTVQWSRPAQYGDLSGLEARLIETAPQQRVHWIGAIDAPSGVVWIDLATDQRWVPGPTDGDLAWTTLRASIRRAL